MAFTDWYKDTYKTGGYGNGREVDWNTYNSQNKDVADYFSNAMKTDEGKKELTNNWGIDVNNAEAGKQFAASHYAKYGAGENRALPMFAVDFPGGSSVGKSFGDTNTSTTPKLNVPNWYQAGLSGDWQGILDTVPGVGQEYTDESTRDKKSINNLSRLGISNAQDYAKWWWNQFGRDSYTPPAEPTPPPATTTDTTPPPATTTTTPPATPPVDEAARQAERLRLQGLSSQYDQLTKSLRRAVTGANYYNGGDLENLGQDITDLLDAIGSEKSAYEDIPFDSAPYKSRLAEAQAALASLSGQRNAALGRETSSISDLLNQLTDIPDWDAESINALIGNLDRRRTSLDRFTGDLTPQLTALEDAYNKANSRLTKISGTRSQIERDAQQLIDQLKLANPQTQADYDALAKLYEDLRGRSSTWRASNASDELTSAADLLVRRKSDLQALLDKLAANQKVEASRINVDSRGNSTFGRRVARDAVSLTPAQIAAIRRRNTRATPYSGSFASSLGL